MIVNNEYDKLRKCIVGREFNLSDKMFDLSFRVFFQNNLEDLDYCRAFEKEYTNEVIQERNEDLDNLAKVLESYGVEVLRPKVTDKVIDVKTPTFKSICRPSSNVRDLTFVYDKTIIETAPSLTGRFFENYWLYDVFKDLFDNHDYNWIQVPKSFLSDDVIDAEDWQRDRDFKDIEQFDMFFDAANALKFNDFILYNYSSANHFKGIKWLEKNLRVPVIPVKITDNHIDGNIVSLNENTILVNDKHLNKSIEELLPEQFKDFNILRLPDSVELETDMSDFDLPHLASKDGMSINVLSIDKKTVVVNKDDTVVCELLDKNGFNVVPVQLRYCRAFGGGIHCSTLDVERTDE